MSEYDLSQPSPLTDVPTIATTDSAAPAPVFDQVPAGGCAPVVVASPAPAPADDYYKLVTRLLNDRWPGKELLAIEAADAITALSAENELLQRELTVIDAMLNPSCTSGVTIESAIRSLQAELAAMRGDRERMRACVAAADAMRADMRYIGCACPKCASIPAYDAARAALNRPRESWLPAGMVGDELNGGQS